MLLAGEKWFEIFVRVQNLNHVHFAETPLVGGVAEEKTVQIKERE